MKAARPGEAAALRKLLFSFEDIVKLDQKYRLILFDKVQTEQVMLALRGAEAEIKEIILSSLGARARRMIESELNDAAAEVTKEVICRPPGHCRDRPQACLQPGKFPLKSRLPVKCRQGCRMSEDQDRDSKTQEASEKKIKDTIEKGNVPVSREVPVLLSLVSILIVCSLMLSGSTAGIEQMLGSIIAEAGTHRLESQLDVAELLTPIAQQSLAYILPMLLVLMAGGIVSSLIQNPFQITFERIEPKASRLSIQQWLEADFWGSRRGGFSEIPVQVCLHLPHSLRHREIGNARGHQRDDQAAAIDAGHHT